MSGDQNNKSFVKIFSPWFFGIVIIVLVAFLVFYQSNEAIQKAFSGIAHSCSSDLDCPQAYPNCEFDENWGYARCVKESQQSCKITLGMTDSACDLSDINSCDRCINSPPWVCRRVSPKEPFIYRKGFCRSGPEGQAECDAKYPGEGFICKPIPSTDGAIPSSEFQSEVSYCTMELPYSEFNDGFGWCLPATNFEESISCNPYTSNTVYMQTQNAAGENIEIWGCSCINPENFDHQGSHFSDCTRSNTCNSQNGLGALYAPIRDENNAEVECTADIDCEAAAAGYANNSVNFGETTKLKCWNKQTGTNPTKDFNGVLTEGVCYADWEKNKQMRDGINETGLNSVDPFTHGFCRCKEGYTSSRSTLNDGNGEVSGVYQDFSCYLDPCLDNIDVVIPKDSPTHYLNELGVWTCPEQATLGMDFCEAGTCKCCDCNHSYKIGGRPTIACPQDFTGNSLASLSICKGRASCVGDPCWVQESNSQEIRLRDTKSGRIGRVQKKTVDELKVLIDTNPDYFDFEILENFKGRWDPSNKRSKCICPSGYINASNSQVPTKQVCQSNCLSNGPCGSGSSNRGNCIYQTSPIEERLNLPDITKTKDNNNALLYPDMLPERICAPGDSSGSFNIDNLVVRQCLQKDMARIESIKRGFQDVFVDKEGNEIRTSNLDDLIQNPYDSTDTRCNGLTNQYSCEEDVANECQWFEHLFNESTEREGMCISSKIKESDFYKLTSQPCSTDDDCGTACTACRNCFQPESVNLDYGRTFVNDYNNGSWTCNSSNGYAPAGTATGHVSNCCGFLNWDRGENNEEIVVGLEGGFKNSAFGQIMCYAATSASENWNLSETEQTDTDGVALDTAQYVADIYAQCMGQNNIDLTAHYGYFDTDFYLAHLYCSGIASKSETLLATNVTSLPHDRYGSPNGNDLYPCQLTDNCTKNIDISNSNASGDNFCFGEIHDGELCKKYLVNFQTNKQCVDNSSCIGKVTDFCTQHPNSNICDNNRIAGTCEQGRCRFRDFIGLKSPSIAHTTSVNISPNNTGFGKAYIKNDPGSNSLGCDGDLVDPTSNDQCTEEIPITRCTITSSQESSLLQDIQNAEVESVRLASQQNLNDRSSTCLQTSDEATCNDISYCSWSEETQTNYREIPEYRMDTQRVVSYVAPRENGCYESSDTWDLNKDSSCPQDCAALSNCDICISPDSDEVNQAIIDSIVYDDNGVPISDKVPESSQLCLVCTPGYSLLNYSQLPTAGSVEGFNWNRLYYPFGSCS